MDKTNVRVKLRIVGDEFDVHKITDVLGVKPDYTWNTGDFIRNSGRKRDCSGWIYSTGAEETLDVNTSLHKVEEVFGSKEKQLVELKERYSLSYFIDIIIIIEEKSPPAFTLETPSIKFASRIGASIDVDMYVN